MSTTKVARRTATSAKDGRAATGAPTTAAKLSKGVPKDILDHTVVVSMGNSKRDTCPARMRVTVSALIESFAQPDTARGSMSLAEYLALNKDKPEEKAIRDAEKDGQYIIPGAFSTPGTRKAQDVDFMSGFVIDLDKGNLSSADVRQRMTGTFCIAFTTYSHHSEDKHWRIFIPYTREIPPAAHHKVYVHFNELFDGNLDARCDTIAQVWYTPACPHDAAHTYDVFVVNGQLLNPDEIPEPVKPVVESVHLPARPNCMSVEVERVRSALASIPSDDRDMWIRLGIALKQQLPEKVGYDLWVAWSQKSTKFDANDAEITWNSFREEYEGNAITLGTLFHEAKSRGWADDMVQMPPEVEALNNTHFVAYQGGRCFVFAEKYDHELGRPTLQSYPLSDFQAHGANKRIRVLDGDKMKSVPVTKLWFDHPARRTYDNIVFMPGLSTPLDVYNSWRGFAVKPTPGDWGALKKHMLDNICQGEVESYEYLMKWMAFAVQFPYKRPGVAVVMQGARGTGKGKLASTFMKLFGSHAMQVTQSGHLTGKFNQHLRDCVFLFVDEALWAGDKEGESVLKGLITEEYLQVERKFSDVVVASNRLHIMMASNNDWVVPAGANERRYFVLQVGDGQMQNHAYFEAIDEQMLRGGGLQAMMHELLQLDLTGFDVRDYPKTAALDEQKLQSLGPDHLWWLDLLGKGDPATWKYQARATLATSFAEHRGTYTDRASETRLGLFLKKVVPGHRKVSAAPHNYSTPVPCYEFPDLAACKAEFIKYHGFVTDPWA